MEGVDFALNTQNSLALARKLRESLPGGDTRTGTFYNPYPVAIEKGDGYRVWDVDGNELIDVWGNFTSLIHGYAFPPIVDALTRQAKRGTVFPSPNDLHGELAQRIRDRIRSVDLLRFTNSGTEAVMLAVRAARAITGRNELIKADGGYHGSWEQVPMSLRYAEPGVPQSVLNLVHFVDYNDIVGLRDLVQKLGDRVAAIILEPVMGGGGVIAGSAEFLRVAQELARKCGCVLIFDEVITARLSMGGYQEVVNVTPDLTTFGKVIGGGLPVGALGGRREILEVFNPTRQDRIAHSGTFNGNAMTLTAGCASLDHLDDVAINRINALGERLAAGLRLIFRDGAVPATVTVCGSIAQIHFGCAHPPTNYKQTNMGAELLARFHRAGLAEGVFFAPRGMFSISTPMNETVVDEVIARLKLAAEKVWQEYDQHQLSAHEPAYSEVAGTETR